MGSFLREISYGFREIPPELVHGNCSACFREIYNMKPGKVFYVNFWFIPSFWFWRFSLDLELRKENPILL